MTFAKPVMYRVTRSDIDTVKPWTTIVDDDNGDEVRTWHLYDPSTGDFAYGWTGRRLFRLCLECLDRKPALARFYGHDHPHGEGSDPDLPTIEETT